MTAYSIHIVLPANDPRDAAGIEAALRHDELAEDAEVKVGRGASSYVAIRPIRPAGYYLRGGTDEDQDLDEVWDWRERVIAWLEHCDPAATLELRRDDGTAIAGTLLTAVEHADPDRREAAEAIARGSGCGDAEWTYVRRPFAPASKETA